ncbi:MAG: pilus assembly protein PilM [Kiritimatiellia bacterium]
MSKNLACGIIVRPGGLEWTLRETGRPDAPVASRKALPRTAETRAPLPPDGLFREEEPRLRHAALHLALPVDQVLMRVLELPTTDPAEISGMVDLQMDDVCPFPAEFITSSWEPVARAEGATRVLLCAVRRSVIQPLGDAAAAAGLDIHRVDVDLLGWLAVMRKAGRLPERGRHIAFLFEDAATTLILFEDASPVLIRSMGVCAGEEDLRAIAEDTGYAMAAAEAEWGAQPVLSATAWYTNAPPARLELLEPVCGVRPRAEALASLDPLTDGLAQRAVAATAGVVNLAPPEWGVARASRLTRRRTLIAAGGGLAAWALLLAVFFGLLGLRKGRVMELEKRHEALKGPVAEVGEMQDRVESLAAYTNATRSVMEVILSVAEALPERVDLTELSYNKSLGFSLRGTGPSDRVLSFTDTFSKSPMFKVSNIDVQGPSDATKFRVSATWPGVVEGSP